MILDGQIVDHVFEPVILQFQLVLSLLRLAYAQVQSLVSSAP